MQVTVTTQCGTRFSIACDGLKNIERNAEKLFNLKFLVRPSYCAVLRETLVFVLLSVRVMAANFSCSYDEDILGPLINK